MQKFTYNNYIYKFGICIINLLNWINVGDQKKIIIYITDIIDSQANHKKH